MCLRRAALLSLLGPVLVCAYSAQASEADSLLDTHRKLSESLATNSFERPLHIESTERAGELQGDIFAVLDRSFSVIGVALRDTESWCEILILHYNVKGCRVGLQKSQATLHVNVGRKFAQPLADTYLLNFNYRVVSMTPGYLRVAIEADDGPMGTSRYRIALELVALDSERSFLHLSYSYRVGTIARVATRLYLATAGRNKVGFTIVGRAQSGEPIYVGKMDGMIERNTMRYFLAIEAHLDALRVPAAEREERRLTAWFTAVERYPAQLRELDRAEYLQMKREEIARQGPRLTAELEY